MYKSFTKEEQKIIDKDFDHWNLPSNKDWVESEIKNYFSTKFVHDRFRELESYGFKLKKLSDIGYILIKLNEMWKIIKNLDDRYLPVYDKYKNSYKSITEELDDVASLQYIKDNDEEYIAERCKIQKFDSFASELGYRITLGEIFEKEGVDYLRERLPEFYSAMEGLNIDDEISQIVALRECEHHASDFTEKRIEHWRKRGILNSPKDEFECRMELVSTEMHVSSYTDKKCKGMVFKNPQEETNIRQVLSEHELHSSLYVEKRISSKEFISYQSLDTLERLKKELPDRQKLFQIGELNKDGVEERYQFWLDRGLVVPKNYLAYELEKKYILKDCLKDYNSEYIKRELNRLLSEELVRDIDEEFRARINLDHYEQKVKDKEKLANKDTFWDMISVDGLANQKLLKDVLNNVGKGFCLAKWNQVSILLQTGQTHSCHHPYPHVVPLDELEKNPTALHNTKFKKEQRKTMLEGERPEECDYCWNVEDANPKAFSDRVMKSGEAWAFPYFDKIKDSNPNDDFNPPYVEISFSNQCNQACGYCDVKSSSNWQQEIATKGPYPTSGMYNNTEWMERENIVPIPFSQPNPYKDAFWKWWPDLFPGLHTFRITGGEPTLHKDTFKVLDYIIENPKINPRLEMSVNSNLTGPQDLLDEFIDKVKYITDNDLLWNFTLFTSIESWGKQAEYMRDGLDTEKFWRNLDMFLTKCQKPEATIMATYNLTSVPTYHKVIKRVFELKKKHYNGKRYRHYALILDTSYLRHPRFLSCRILPTEWVKKIRDDVKLMTKFADEKYTYIYGHGHGGFYDFEREKLRRVVDWVETDYDDVMELIKLRMDFVKFIDEYDIRRGKNFLETFPMFESFYDTCKKLI
jgi:hypothetical protein